ncbi:unnamed protein product [Sphagnum jensenii]|uniref:Uncharacterized protein n=1 Tax=Sphagnum jensenii TaxID=128206 RepID=A0ABP0VA02_9BRYO
MWVSPSYVGNIYYRGRRLWTAKKHEPKQVRIAKFSEALPEFAPYGNKPKLFTKIDKFYATISHEFIGDDGKPCKMEDLYPSEIDLVEQRHEEYRRKFAQELWKVYKQCATINKPVLFVRGFNSEKDTLLLYEFLAEEIQNERLSEDYRLLKYFGKLDDVIFGDGKETQRKTVKEVLIDEFVHKSKFCMIFAVDRGRMGDAYPKECATFLDFVEDSQSWDTILQATVGRASAITKIRLSISTTSLPRILLSIWTTSALTTEPDWKRVEGGKCKESERHFYEEVLTNEVIDEISDFTGFRYAYWGDIDTKAGRPIQIGGFLEGDKNQPVSVGIRANRSEVDWMARGRDASGWGRFGTVPKTAKNGSRRLSWPLTHQKFMIFGLTQKTQDIAAKSMVGTKKPAS